MNWDEIFWACDRHSVGTEILSKYVAEYEYMRKGIVEFFSKFLGCGIKIARVNSIDVAKPWIFFNMLRDVGR